MPRWNGRGPWYGTGPGTGWGMGPCGAGMRRTYGFRRGGFYPGRGFGAGWQPPFAGQYPEMDPADEKAALEDEMSALEAQMREIRDRLDRIEKNS